MGTQVNPTTLFLIEGGGGQLGSNAGMCWGDGFFTNPCVPPSALTPRNAAWLVGTAANPQVGCYAALSKRAGMYRSCTL